MANGKIKEFALYVTALVLLVIMVLKITNVLLVQ